VTSSKSREGTTKETRGAMASAGEPPAKMENIEFLMLRKGVL
jgi:hypothetical protein